MNAELSDNHIQSLPFSKLRVIPFSIHTGAFNMACDVFLAKQAKQTQIPVLRFYGWQPFCLSLGFHQKINDVNTRQLIKDGIDLVRRPTGGSAILHAQELTYSFIIPNNGYSHHSMYEFFHFILARVLIRLGYPVALSNPKNSTAYLNKGKDTFACFNRKAKSEIQYKGKKVVGSAQKVYKDSILQHGSIIINNRHEQIINYLNSSATEKTQQLNILKSNSISIKEIKKNEISEISLSKALIEEFANYTYINMFYQYLQSDEIGHIHSSLHNYKMNDRNT